METFPWKSDHSGLLVLQHILTAADRGVRVRILLDDSFTMHEDLALHAIDDHPNIEYRIYSPFRVRQDSVVLRQLFALGELNRRLRELLAPDFHPRNAWAVRLSPQGEPVWIGEHDSQHPEPVDSQMQRLEEWFLGMLSIDGEM